jgi:pyridoxamine 5'-phosphate oxidase
MNFYWDQRQVRIEGVATKISDAESDAYFLSRPKGSQIGAWVSNQSSRLNSRAELDSREQEISARFEKEPIYRYVGNKCGASIKFYCCHSD